MVYGKLEGVFLYLFLNEISNGHPYHLHIEVYPGRSRAIRFYKGSVCKACLYLMMNWRLPYDLKVSRKHELVLL